MRVKLEGGFYQAKDIIANAQQCLNLIPEINPETSQAPVRVTTLLSPGASLQSPAPIKLPNRGTYTASNGNVYTVIGNGIYFVRPTFQIDFLGTMYGNRTNPVSISDNGLVVLIVDGSSNGYTIIMASNTFGTISDAAFYGGDRVDFVNNFFVINKPGTRIWYANIPTANTASGIPVFSNVSFPLGIFGEKTIYPDPIETLIAVHGEVLLIGSYTTEVWYNAGTTGFPFALYQGVCFEHGLDAKYSVAKQDIAVYWLARDRQGQKVVLRYTPYGIKRISTHAIENEFSKYSVTDDAIGFTYLQVGHQYYVLTFPNANATWVYDELSELWHQRATTDANGNLNRIRANCYANAYGLHIVGDFALGNLLVLGVNAYTDYIDGLGPNADGSYPITRIRSFPHLLDNGDRIVHKSFTADMDVGNNTGADGSTSTNPPTVSLRWSDTKGASWNNRLEQSLGAAGEYLTQLQWNRLGLARDRIYELSWSGNEKTALNGAFIEIEKSET